MGRGEYGAVAALPVWVDYMKVALADTPAAFMPQPNGIISVRIDPATGRRARAGQEGAVFELFREENAPEALPADIGNGGQISGGSAGGLPQSLF